MTERGFYILDPTLEPAVAGVPGEFYLADERLLDSYFSSVGVEAQRFVADPFAGPGRRMFRTGELVVETPDELISPARPPVAGNAELELAQIEFALFQQHDARHVAVSAPHGDLDRGPVAAYVAVAGTPLEARAVHEHARSLLPERLVPEAIAVVDGLPLAAPGSVSAAVPVEPVDADQVPLEQAGDESARAYRLQTLRALFAEVLGVAEAGLNDSFLELGGQSVTAMLLIGRVNAALQVQLSIADLFESPTVAQLEQRVLALSVRATNPFDAEDARYTVLSDAGGRLCLWPASVTVPSGWTPVHGPAGRGNCLDHLTQHWNEHHGSASEAVGTAEPIGFPLSFNQEFFCDLDEGETAGAFSDRHTLVSGWRLSGPLDVEALQFALDELVRRHEILRTEIRRDVQPRLQVVHPPSPAPLDVRELMPSAGQSREFEQSREFQCEQLMTEVEARTVSVLELPLLRAVLGRLDERDWVLVLAVHHIAIDAWSMQVVIRDLAACYANRRGFDVALPVVRQYREYSVAQRSHPDPSTLRPARAYWREALAGARALRLPTRPAPVVAGQSRYAMRHFTLDEELAAAALRLAGEARCSPFMVLLSGFYLLAHELTGTADLVVPTFTTGRYEAGFADTVGPFLNYLPVRTELSGAATFREVVARTRASCVQAYSHDIPFDLIAAEAPELFGPPEAAGAQVAFEMVQSPSPAEGDAIGDISYHEVHRRLMFEADCPDIPNGMLWVLDQVSATEIIGTIQFKRTEFTGQAVAGLVSGYRRLLRQSMNAPDEQLDPPL